MARDWKSATPRGDTLDAKLNIRCKNKTKTFLQRAAKRKGVGTSEFVLDASVAAASATLGEKPPTS